MYYEICRETPLSACSKGIWKDPFPLLGVRGYSVECVYKMRTKKQFKVMSLGRELSHLKSSNLNLLNSKTML